MISVKEKRDFAETMMPNPSEMLDDAIDWICNHLRPEEVFPEDDLNAWAESNGYVHKDSLS